MIPEGWDRQPVGKLCKSIVPGRNKPKKFDGNIAWITTPDIQDKYIPSKGQKNFVNKEAIVESGAKTIPAGSVIITAVGDLGLTAIASEPIVLNQQLHAFVCPDFINSEFLAYYLETQKSYMERVASKTTIPYMNKSNCESIPIAYPPLPEQKKIAQILSTWDKAIETVEKLIENSQQKKKALMQQLLTGKKRFPGFDGEWKEVRLKSLLVEVKERNKDNSVQRVLSVTNHSGFVLPENQFSKRVASNNVRNYKVVKRGQFGYNPSRINVGSFARLEQYKDGILSPMYVVFRVKENQLNSDYFLAWMSTNEAKQRILNSTQGSVRDSVGFDSLCGFPFLLPPIEEQQKIASVLSSADQEIETWQQELEHLKQEKKNLMQQLLTGKRRVVINA